MLGALATTAGLPSYILGDEIRGDVLRRFEGSPSLTAPLVCMLCSSSFLTESCFLRHFRTDHAGYAEYRKRVFYLLEERG